MSFRYASPRVSAQRRARALKEALVGSGATMVPSLSVCKHVRDRGMLQGRVVEALRGKGGVQREKVVGVRAWARG